MDAEIAKYLPDRETEEITIAECVWTLFTSLVDSMGGPVVVVLAILALLILIYTACSLFRMCKEECHSAINDKSASYEGLPTMIAYPRRIYEIQEEEGVCSLPEGDLKLPLNISKSSSYAPFDVCLSPDGDNGDSSKKSLLTCVFGGKRPDTPCFV